MNEKEITLPQFLEAQQYVRGFIKMHGGNPFDDAIQPWWPEDVKKAAEVRDTFVRNIEEDGIIP